MSTTTTDQAATAGHVDGRTLARRALVALVGAVVVNLLVTVLAGVAGVAPGLDPLNVGPVALFTAIGVVGATVVYAALTRFVDDPNRTFTIVAAVVLVLSFVPDVVVAPTLPGATTAGVVVLAVLHVTTAVVCVLALTGRVDVS
jgi:hypothetical protein